MMLYSMTQDKPSPHFLDELRNNEHTPADQPLRTGPLRAVPHPRPGHNRRNRRRTNRMLQGVGAGGVSSVVLGVVVGVDGSGEEGVDGVPEVDVALWVRVGVP